MSELENISLEQKERDTVSDDLAAKAIQTAEARIAQLEAELERCRMAYGKKLLTGSCVQCAEPGALCEACLEESRIALEQKEPSHE